MNNVAVTALLAEHPGLAILLAALFLITLLCLQGTP